MQNTIGQYIHAKGLCDMGASINLMPLSLYLKVRFSSPKITNVVLQLIDRSITRFEGVVEDVLVQVGLLFFPIEFVVIDLNLIMKFHSLWDNFFWPR